MMSQLSFGGAHIQFEEELYLAGRLCVRQEANLAADGEQSVFKGATSFRCDVSTEKNAWLLGSCWVDP